MKKKNKTCFTYYKWTDLVFAMYLYTYNWEEIVFCDIYMYMTGTKIKMLKHWLKYLTAWIKSQQYLISDSP